MDYLFFPIEKKPEFALLFYLFSFLKKKNTENLNTMLVVYFKRTIEAIYNSKKDSVKYFLLKINFNITFFLKKVN